MENYDDKEKTDEGHQQEEGLVVQEGFRQKHEREERKTMIAKEFSQPRTKSEKSRSLDAKPPRRNLSFRSKKQTTQTQSVDVSSTLGTVLEKKLHWEFDSFFLISKQNVRKNIWN